MAFSAAKALGRAAALVGWLGGAITGATWEQKAQLEAQAYAEARVREERAVGFAART